MSDYKSNEDLKEDLQEYATEHNIKFNPDEGHVNRILNGLLKIQEIKGEIYCPCRVPTGDKEKDKSIACPCTYNLGEIKKDGHCKCNLFVKKE